MRPTVDQHCILTLTRAFTRVPSRRDVLRGLIGAGLGLGSLRLSDVAGAKNKRKRKKKRKKCTGGTKRCRKKCISSTSCCSSSDCGSGATCVDGICNCPSGFKNCEGACILAGQCCGACPGDKVCDEGVCACPANAPFECPGDQCFSEGQCCVTEGCPVGFECVEGLCLCPGADAINCNGICCDSDTEVCKVEKVGNEFVSSCQPGSCPPTDFCTDRDTEQFLCANDLGRTCVCTSTTDPIPGRVCVDFNLLVDNNPCEECDTSSDCGTGRVCISGGDGCVCSSNFCVPLCPEVTGNSAKRGTGGTPVDPEALKGGLRR
jgi:hypothetical protein